METFKAAGLLVPAGNLREQLKSSLNIVCSVLCPLPNYPALHETQAFSSAAGDKINCGIVLALSIVLSDAADDMQVKLSMEQRHAQHTTQCPGCFALSLATLGLGIVLLAHTRREESVTSPHICFQPHLQGEDKQLPLTVAYPSIPAPELEHFETASKTFLSNLPYPYRCSSCLSGGSVI